MRRIRIPRPLWVAAAALIGVLFVVAVVTLIAALLVALTTLLGELA